MVETDVKQSLSRPELWERILLAKLPVTTLPGTLFSTTKYTSFEKQLATKHDLTDESARRLKEEYRRFLYLKVVDGGVLTPSEWVDRAWHQHLETEGGAWDEYCKEALQSKLEHKTGLPSAEAKASYARALDLYRREFKEEPPPDIWPSLADQENPELAKKYSLFGIGFVLLGFFSYLIGVASLDFFQSFSESNSYNFFIFRIITNFLYLLFYYLKIVGVLSIILGFILMIIGIKTSFQLKNLEREVNCG
jgi:hypothetical protein